MSNYPIAKSLFESWLTPTQLAEAEPAFSLGSVRNLIFNAADRKSSEGIIPGNGLEPHIRHIGSKVLLNHGGFISWIDTSEKKRKRIKRNVDGKENAAFVKVVGSVRQDANEPPNSKQGRGRRT